MLKEKITKNKLVQIELKILSLSEKITFLRKMHRFQQMENIGHIEMQEFRKKGNLGTFSGYYDIREAWRRCWRR